jgi:hypothetical protein
MYNKSSYQFKPRLPCDSTILQLWNLKCKSVVTECIARVEFQTRMIFSWSWHSDQSWHISSFQIFFPRTWTLKLITDSTSVLGNDVLSPLTYCPVIVQCLSILSLSPVLYNILCHVSHILCLFIPYFSLCIFEHYVFIGSPLWSSGHSSWLQIQRPGFDSRRYQIFWEVAGRERGPLSLESTIKELLGG